MPEASYRSKLIFDAYSEHSLNHLRIFSDVYCFVNAFFGSFCPYLTNVSSTPLYLFFFGRERGGEGERLKRVV